MTHRNVSIDATAQTPPAIDHDLRLMSNYQERSEMQLDDKPSGAPKVTPPNVFVMMGENETGFFGLVCKTKGRAEAELRRILSTYKSAPDGSLPLFTTARIEELIQEAFDEAVTVQGHDTFWITESDVLE
jgi:hypothetical protein